jgi:glycosyltransferase involved in cell wall biosynthesis
VYELCRSLDRDRYEIELLVRRGMPADEYYYSRIRALGIVIHRRMPVFLDKFRRHVRGLYNLPFVRWGLTQLHRVLWRLSAGNLLARFDVINAVQIENYYLVQPLLASNDRVLVYLMSNAFQYPFDPYEACLPERSYRFVINDLTQRKDYERSPCSHADDVFFPLAMDLRGRPDLSESARNIAPYRIGVFMRLSPERPISGLFQALAHLEREVSATLHVYGRGDSTQFRQELEELGIAGRVVFEGHSHDLEETVRSAGLSMIWMPSNGPIFGYASVELASFGFPMAFWDLSGATPEEIRAATGDAVDSFAAPAELARHTGRLLADEEGLRSAGKRLRAYVLQQYDIRGHLPVLEEEFSRIAGARREL